jgi:hypothetical protein
VDVVQVGQQHDRRVIVLHARDGVVDGQRKQQRAERVALLRPGRG